MYVWQMTCVNMMLLKTILARDGIINLFLLIKYEFNSGLRLKVGKLITQNIFLKKYNTNISYGGLRVRILLTSIFLKK